MNARRSTDLSQWLSRPNAGDAARRAQPAHPEAAPGIVFSRLSGAAPDGGEGAGSGDPGSLDRRRLHPPGRRAGSRDGHDRHFQVLGQQAVQGHRRASEWLSDPPNGRRMALPVAGLHIGPSEAEVFWSDFLKSLKARGLTGIKLVISDAHEGLKAAIVRVLGATWQRCRVHWTRNALAYVPKGQHTMVAAALRQAFQQPDDAAARTALLHVAEMMRARWPKLAAFIVDSEAVLA